MSGLNEQQLAELRAELEKQLATLEKSMVVTEQATKPVELDQSSIGRLSRMDSMLSQGMAKGLQERESIHLARIQNAFRRLEAGTYGACTACGGAVAFERLLVFPETSTCVQCG